MAKRELHAFRNTRPAWIGTLAAGVLLGLAGPFGTDEVMRLIPRVLYWMCIASLTYLTGTILDARLRPPLSRRLSIWFAVPIVSVVTACVITLQILGINGIIFGFFPDMRGGLILFGNVFAASLVISSAAVLMAQSPSVQTKADDPRILARLPFAKRGALISLSAVDHYVEVTTNAGSELVLMRLSDAIAEAEPVEGMQIHRSHWVALNQIKNVERAKGKTTVVMTTGSALPVSRSNVAQLKDAGLLPQGTSHA